MAPLIRNGQTMDPIFAEHKEEIPCSERTLYRYIDSGILSVRNIDLPRKVKYKPRRQSDTSEKLTKMCIRDSEKSLEVILMNYLEARCNAL